MNKNHLSLILLSLICFGNCSETQTYGLFTLSRTTTSYPLFGQSLLTPQRASSIAHSLIQTKHFLRSTSLTIGLVAVLVGLYYEINPPRHSTHGEQFLTGLYFGGAIPLITYLSTELIIPPTIGIVTMASGS